MTLVLSVQSRDSLWLLVNRRLSYGGRRPPIDDAVKVMDLETTDGPGLPAYAGLGATPQGTQPSEWRGAELRRRGGSTFEQALGILLHCREQGAAEASGVDASRCAFIASPLSSETSGRGSPASTTSSTARRAALVPLHEA